MTRMSKWQDAGGVGLASRDDSRQSGLGEGDVRPVARAALREAVADPVALLVDELVLGEHGRVDVAVIAEAMHGVELKSDRDSLARLERQMSSYSSVFDFCTLVVTPRHLSGARERLWRGWGLAVLQPDPSGQLRYRQVRQARPNRRVQPGMLVQLLWRSEALAALEAAGAADGYRSKPRTDLWDRLCEVCPVEELKTTVRTALKERRGWRDGAPPRARAAKFRPEDVSSHFLARRIR